MRFDGVAEVDPSHPAPTLVWRLALGRFGREGARRAVAPDGRVAACRGEGDDLERL